MGVGWGCCTVVVGFWVETGTSSDSPSFWRWGQFLFNFILFIYFCFLTVQMAIGFLFFFKLFLFKKKKKIYMFLKKMYLFALNCLRCGFCPWFRCFVLFDLFGVFLQI